MSQSADTIVEAFIKVLEQTGRKYKRKDWEFRCIMNRV